MRRAALSGLLLSALLAASYARAQPGAVKPDEVKAVFLLNFAKFVDWPPEAFVGPDAPIVIGVLGPDPFGPLLDQAVAGETVGARHIVVKRFASLEELGRCHILYIAASERPRLNRIFDKLDNDSVLTVGEMDRFTRLGGIINLRVERGRVRFDINKEAADRAGLRVHSQLMRVARSGRRD